MEGQETPEHLPGPSPGPPLLINPEGRLHLGALPHNAVTSGPTPAKPGAPSQVAPLTCVLWDDPEALQRKDNDLEEGPQGK